MSDPQPQPARWLPAPSSPPRARRLVGVATAVAGVALLGVVAAGLFGAVVLRPRLLRVPSHSMEPAIHSGDYVLVSRNVRTIARGDVVAFQDLARPEASHLFRVVALPGERFQIAGGLVYVDGKLLEEPYVASENRDYSDYGPFRLPSNKYFLMGDNRRTAADSRYFGSIERDAIWGKWVLW